MGLERCMPSKVAPQVRSVTEALATFAAVKGHPRGSGRWCWPWSSNRGWNHRQRGLIHGGRSRVAWGFLWSILETQKQVKITSPVAIPSLSSLGSETLVLWETRPMLRHAHHQAIPTALEISLSLSVSLSRPSSFSNLPSHFHFTLLPKVSIGSLNPLQAPPTTN